MNKSSALRSGSLTFAGRRSLRLAALLLLLTTSACGSRDPGPSSTPPPPAAEPADSPQEGTAADIFGELGESLPPERLARIAQLIRRSEDDPFGPHAPEVRFLVAAWLTQSPDVHVTLCPFFAGTHTQEAATELVMNAFNVASQRDEPVSVTVFHYAAGMAAFMIEQGGQGDPDGTSVQVAGLEAMLRVYQTARARGLVDPLQPLDDLSSKRDDGTLAAWYAESVQCGDGGA